TPVYPPFPYTTLFRSRGGTEVVDHNTARPPSNVRGGQRPIGVASLHTAGGSRASAVGSQAEEEEVGAAGADIRIEELRPAGTFCRCRSQQLLRRDRSG